jgi:magnesium-transporting ATPase (P-type)
MSIHKRSTATAAAGSSSAAEVNTLFLKGAPDVLLAKCSHYLHADGEQKLIDEEFMKTYISRYEGFGGNGERVLGFAFKDLPRLMRDELIGNPRYLDSLKDNLVGKVASLPLPSF